MTIKTFSVVLLLSLAWTACNNDTPQQSAAPTEATPAASTESTADLTATQEVAPDLSATPGTLTPTPQPATAPAATAPATGGSGKVNPPHGQPGHVCGTPVGAPLDGSAASAGKPAQGAQPATKSISVPAPSGTSGASGANATVAPGTNPPHGQPGHVCGTPVGSPLPKQ